MRDSLFKTAQGGRTNVFERENEGQIVTVFVFVKIRNVLEFF
jgi:hypothetical protein